MALTKDRSDRERKEDSLAFLAESIQNAQGVVFADYRGMTVAEVADFRKKLRDTDATFGVVKNTLFRIASEDHSQDAALKDVLNGPTAASFAMKDVVATTKVFLDYVAANRNTKLSVKGGMVKGRFFTPEQMTALTKLPPREVLIGRLLGQLQAPIANFVGTLANLDPTPRFVYTLGAITSNFVYTLQAVADKKQAEGGA